ncbi:MAG: AAA family ATPase [Elainellaceae cyanobacterium]
MDLFDHQRQQLEAREAPLAARMRPRVLDEFIGQDHIVGPGRLLRRAIQADQLSSLLLYGPPGTGKTTLARIIANTTRSHFISINAVLAGVKDLRVAIATAQDQRGQHGQRTILFVDEVHRFNKAQQDALLPWVENGTLVLIGATTENPYFEVNKALVSRSRLFRLLPLGANDLRRVVHQALNDSGRGYGDRPVRLDADAEDHLVNVANGDARALLNALELAVETTPPSPGGKQDLEHKGGQASEREGEIHITLAVAEDSIQQRAVLYDKEGDAHFDTISAFIKSVRGSDPDAALYWLARMVYAGEDPRFLFRRLVILASEDVGLAEPNAVAVVNACAQAFDRVGMPEGRYPLAQATLYLATAPKSNTTMGFFDALAAVAREQEDAIPPHLQDANRDAAMGHGQNYLYPHAYRDHWVAQQYLPNNLQGQVFYQPSTQGYEGRIAAQVQQRREAQLAAVMGEVVPEILTLSPEDGSDRWIQRSLSQASDHLSQVRDRLFERLRPQRHHVLLTVNSHGLLVWEAVRRVPEGGVYAAVTDAERAALAEQAQLLPELRQPMFLPTLGAIADEGADVEATERALKSPKAAGLPTQPPPELGGRGAIPAFDGIVGRNLLLNAADRAATASALASVMAPDTTTLLAESLPKDSQRISQLLTLSDGLSDRLIAAERALYDSDPNLAWGRDDLVQLLEASPLMAQVQVESMGVEMYLSPGLVSRWSDPGEKQPSYCDRLTPFLSAQDLEAVCQGLRSLTAQTVVWKTQVAFVYCAGPIA